MKEINLFQKGFHDKLFFLYSVGWSRIEAEARYGTCYRFNTVGSTVVKAAGYLQLGHRPWVSVLTRAPAVKLGLGQFADPFFR